MKTLILSFEVEEGSGGGEGGGGAQALFKHGSFYHLPNHAYLI